MNPHRAASMTRAVSALALIVTALFSVGPSRARACGGIAPAWTLLTTANGSVLAGTRVLKIYQYVGFEKTTYTLRAQKPLTPETVVPLTVRKTASSWLVELDLGDQSIDSSTQYTLEIVGSNGDSDGGSVPTTIKFDGLNSWPFPNSLGTLQLERRDVGRLNLGGCGSGRDGVQAVLALNSSPEAAEWERQAEHQLLVDGKPAVDPELPRIDYVARVKPLKVRALAFCSDTQYGGGDLFVDAIDVQVEPGVHELRWRTRYADGRELTSNAVQVDMRCDVATTIDAGGADAAIATAANVVETTTHATADAAASPVHAASEDGAPNTASDPTHVANCSAIPASSRRESRAVGAAVLALLSIALCALRRSRANS